MQLDKVDPEHRPVESLAQGSVFTIEGLSFLFEGEKFTLKGFYPEVNLSGVRHGMVMSQSCDLVRSGGRKIKVPYITIGFLEPFHRHIRRDEDWSKVALPWTISTSDQGEERYTLVCSDFLESALEENLDNLLQNNAKNHFFVSFEEDPVDLRYYTLNLTKAFPIQSRHYDELAKNVTHVLKSDFAHKLGWKLAELYGRAATEDYEVDAAKTVLTELYGIIDRVVMRALAKPVPVDKKGFLAATGKKDCTPVERRDVMVEILDRMREEAEAIRARQERKAAKDRAFREKAQAAKVTEAPGMTETASSETKNQTVDSGQQIEPEHV